MSQSAVMHTYMTIERFYDNPQFADAFYRVVRDIVVLAQSFSHEQLSDELSTELFDAFNDIIEGDCGNVSSQQVDELLMALSSLRPRQAASA